ncbi:SulP family inorganic anion transporter [Alicyclobacillus sp. ALC3]|uniref:SulP family inorganic anion transporter n=1 Tax=Alicyclobacillus sp. ALC3 TaxID=2796143 RepID=UPI002378F4FF|nr:SulP family inorganic anion transporter [Alicyclobacillus sp. ALC3]WDL95777.1 SulP family inorganic anion transporter [Alicyclobacillus sp. ALC3]
MVFENVREEWLSNVRQDILAGAAVAFALIPEAIAFSMIAGVNPMIGLYGAFIVAVVVSIFGGRVGMISGATGSTALLMVLLVKNHGDQYLFAAGVLAGLIQLAISVLKLSRFITFVSRSVVIGFVNALAILIFMAQLPHVMGQGVLAYIVCAVTVALVWGLPFVTKVIPSSLIAIVVMTAANMLLKLPLQTVGEIGHLQAHLPYFHIPSVPFDFHTLAIIFPYALPIALVGSLETLMTATVIDDTTNSKSDKNKEIRGQGIANIVTGFFGAMAGCAMIGQSTLNVEYGGRKRLSTFVSGALLIVLIVVLRPVVSRIPVAALVGVMFMVSYYTFEWKSLRDLWRVPILESLVMVATVVTVIVTNDLAMGVFVGVVLNAVFIGWKMARIHATTTTSLSGVRTYTVKGQMFFATVTHFVDMFDVEHDPYEVVIDFSHTHVWDHASVTGIQRVMDRYDAFGKSVSLVGLNEESMELTRRSVKVQSA